MKNNLITLLLAGAFCISCNGTGNNAKPVEETSPSVSEAAQEVKADSVIVYEHDYIVTVGVVAPDFAFEMLDGIKFTLLEDRG